LIKALINGRGLVDGIVSGSLVASRQSLSFLGGVDRFTGEIVDRKNNLYGERIAGKILYIPTSVGSTVGAYIIYSICKNNLGPKAIVCEKADSTLVTGCAIAGIPLVEGIYFNQLLDRATHCVLNGFEGTLCLQ
jgi:predicted aconitase with swiveling domain